MTGAFDRALESRELRFAAQEFALRHGRPGTPGYRSAWLRFRERARVGEPLPQARHRQHDLAPALGAGLDGDDRALQVLNVAIHQAMGIDGATMANAQLLDPRTQALRLAAQHGFSAEFLSYFRVVNDTTTACGRALERGATVLVSDVAGSPVFAHTAGLQVMLRAGSRAVASVPVRSPTGRVIAMISTHHCETTTWSEDRRQALSELGTSVGRMLHHALASRGRGDPQSQSDQRQPDRRRPSPGNAGASLRLV